eukprot:m.315764 g.315764  ORF g.315764 m.315764 type:complete len:73 (-) comp55452_c0_seq5:75-293(-)
MALLFSYPSPLCNSPSGKNRSPSIRSVSYCTDRRVFFLFSLVSFRMARGAIVSQSLTPSDFEGSVLTDVKAF